MLGVIFYSLFLTILLAQRKKRYLIQVFNAVHVTCFERWVDTDLRVVILSIPFQSKIEVVVDSNLQRFNTCNQLQW